MAKRVLIDTNLVFTLAEIHKRRNAFTPDQLRAAYKKSYTVYERIMSGELQMYVPPISQMELSAHPEMFRKNLFFLMDAKAILCPIPIGYFVKTCKKMGNPDFNLFLSKLKRKHLEEAEKEFNEGMITRKEFNQKRDEIIEKYNRVMASPDDLSVHKDIIDPAELDKMERRKKEIRRYEKQSRTYLKEQCKSITAESYKDFQYKSDIITALTLFYTITKSDYRMMNKKDIFDTCFIASAAVLGLDEIYTHNINDYSEADKDLIRIENKTFKAFLQKCKNGSKAYRIIASNTIDLRKIDESTRLSTMISTYMNLGIHESNDKIPEIFVNHIDGTTTLNGGSGKEYSTEKIINDEEAKKELTAEFISYIKNDESRFTLANRLSRMLQAFNLKGADLEKHTKRIIASLNRFIKEPFDLTAPEIHMFTKPKNFDKVLAHFAAENRKATTR